MRSPWHPTLSHLTALGSRQTHFADSNTPSSVYQWGVSVSACFGTHAVLSALTAACRYMRRAELFTWAGTTFHSSGFAAAVLLSSENVAQSTAR